MIFKPDMSWLVAPDWDLPPCSSWGDFFFCLAVTSIRRTLSGFALRRAHIEGYFQFKCYGSSKPFGIGVSYGVVAVKPSFSFVRFRFIWLSFLCSESNSASGGTYGGRIPLGMIVKQ